MSTWVFILESFQVMASPIHISSPPCHFSVSFKPCYAHPIPLTLLWKMLLNQCTGYNPWLAVLPSCV